MNTEFFKFEDKEFDIPFYNGNPEINSKKLIALIAGLAIAFCSLFIFPIEGYKFQKAIFFTLVTLIPVWYAMDGNLSEVFKKPKLGDIKIIIIGLVGLFAMAIICNMILTGGTNSPTDNSVNGSASVMVISLIIQLVGEELFKFIAIILTMTFTYKALGRKGAIIAGVIVSQLIFSFAHIPAYGLDIVRLVVYIGIGTIILPIIYVKTKNLTLTYIIHLINDLIGILPVILGVSQLLLL